MTQEEKAKRYDEALESMRDWITYVPIDEVAKNYILETFPELKESEDERIRKEIIQFFKEKDEEDFEEWVPKVEILTWLEKQVPACLSHDDEIMIRQLTEYFTTGKGLQNTNDTVVEWLADVKRKFEKQGEQKPNTVLDIEIPFGAKDSELQEVTYYIPKGFHAEIDDDKVVIKKGEKSTTWSVEDENRTNRLIAYFEDKESFTAEDDVVYANWLKSLKERVQPQPKQEWKQENTDDLTDFENAMMHIGGSFFGENAALDPNDTNVIKEQANLLLELVPSKECGEEDEKNINFLCELLTDLQVKSTENEIKHGTNSHSEYYYNIKKWLKDKVQSQPQIERLE